MYNLNNALIRACDNSQQSNNQYSDILQIDEGAKALGLLGAYYEINENWYHKCQ